MKVTFIGHASILVEAAGVSVLSDPWWNGPCFGAQWWAYPLPQHQLLDGKQIDYIYISHGHHDHLHTGTLATLPKTAKVLVSSSLDLTPSIRAMGFEVIEVQPDRPTSLGDSGLQAHVMPTYGDDTLLALSDGQQVCLNLNDALHSAPAAVQDAFIQRLTAQFPSIDYAFCGYGVASHFPNCYRVPGKDAAASAAKRQAYFNREWVRIMDGLKPRFGFPFAADVVFLQEELFWSNEATHNPERPTDVFSTNHPHATTQVVDIAPGFQVADHVITADIRRQPVTSEHIRAAMGPQVERANRIGPHTDAIAMETRQSLESNLSNCHAWLATFAGDYRIAIAFAQSPTSLLLEKRGALLTVAAVATSDLGPVDLTYHTRWAYLRWALQRPFGDEILFVGSGGIFDYASRAAAKRNLHRELMVLIRNQPGSGEQRPAVGLRSLVRGAKQLVKRMLGRKERDLYDLLGWTVFKQS
ncbi:MAG: MBL fold metallo-hydrolase [Burkholderiales bacterium]